jgi:hypothetical protein
LVFNDPFDCKVNLSLHGTKQEWKQHVWTILKRFRPELNNAQRQAEVDRIISERRHENPEFRRNMIADAQRDIYQNIGIFSLSACNDDILMWSYYAHSHEGLCLGFLSRVGPLGPALSVLYADRFPQVEYLKDDPERQVEVNLLTKAAAWKHEQEWRVIDYNKGPGLREYPPELLSEVILGVRMPQKDRKEVLSWVETHRPKPEVFQALIKDGEYALQIRRL